VKDLIIIGGGPAGLTAGIYAKRSGLDTILIEKAFSGGQAATTSEIENFPGFPEGISGADFSMRMEAQAKRFGLEFVYDEVLEISCEGEEKVVKTLSGEYRAKTLIVATGAVPRELGLPNEKRLRGYGVSYCATCDGAFFGGKEVAIVGGGNTATEDALFLSRYTKKVYFIHRRDELRADKIYHSQIFENEKIEPLLSCEVVELFEKDGVLDGIGVINKKTGEVTRVNVAALFVGIGTDPQAKLCEGLEKNAEGYVLADEDMQTSIEGVFVAGDIKAKPLKQVITAAADGAIAAMSVARYLFE